MISKKGAAKAIALAIGGVVLTQVNLAVVQGGTTTWQSSTSGSWLAPANWTGGVPGQNDTALFVGTVPPSNTVSIGSDTSVGAIVDSYSSGTGLTINGTSNVNLFGQTVSIQQGSASASATYTQGNVVLASGSNDTTKKTLTLGSGINLNLNNSTNYMLGSTGTPSTAGGTITINGNISEANGASAGINFYGGGTKANVGNTFILAGSNSFTGGMVIGAPVANLNDPVTQGAAVQVTSPSAIPSSGSITVNDQSQLQFNTAGTYGAIGQMLTLNGDGQNPGNFSSGALRTGGSATDTFIWQGDVTIGQALGAGDPNTPYIVISVTSAASKTLIFNGHVTGSGNLQKQAQGTLRFSGSHIDYTGNTQIGNGVITVEPGSNMGSGELSFFQTSSNTTTVNLFNSSQTIANLNSFFSTTTDTGSPTANVQALNLGGDLGAGLGGTFSGTASCALTINQTHDTTFGSWDIHNTPTLTSTIQGPGSVTISAASNHTLTLNGPNLYVGGTTIAGGTLNLANGTNGSATGFGDVEVKNGGHLATGNAIVNTVATTDGSMSGNLLVDTGGVIAPGNDTQVGSLNVGGNLTLASGAVFNIDATGTGAALVTDKVIANGTLSLNSGAATVNVNDASTATGQIKIISFAQSNFAGTFTLGTPSVIGGRHYSLTTTPTGVTLSITDNSAVRYWSVGGGSLSPSGPADGGGSWTDGNGANFFSSNPDTPNSPFDNTASTNVVIGNGGNGDQIILGSDVRVGGTLIFGPNSSAYTIGVPADTHSVTLVNGISATGNATINAPVQMEQSQTISPQVGVTITTNGPVTDNGHTLSITKTGSGTFVMNGTSTYTGGTTVSAGALQVATWALPLAATGPAVTDNASLVFSNPTSGVFAGRITGTGSVSVNNPSPTAVVTFTNVSNSYAGATNLQAGVLSIDNINELGSGAGGILLNGGTLQAGADLSFPLGTPSRRLTLNSGTSTIDTNGHNVTFNQTIGGAAALVKTGAGTLTLTGLVNAVIIGDVAVNQGTLFLNPAASAGFGLAASPSDQTTFAGNLELAGGLELRMFGGYFSGGGTIRTKSSGISLIARMPNTVIGNSVVFDDNTPGVAGFSGNIGANANSTMLVTGAITGLSDVDFTGGAGTVQLAGTSTYSGTNTTGTGPNPAGPLTTIDNSSGGEVQLMVDNPLPTNTRLHLTSTGLFDMNGFSQTVSTLDSSNNSSEVINNGSGISTLTINGSGSTTYSGFLFDGGSGSVALVLASTNTGSLTLTATNTYSGGTTLNGGTLIISKDSNLGAATGSLSFGGGALAMNSVTMMRPIAINPGGGTIDVSAGKDLSITGSGTTIWNGTLNTTDSGTVSFSRTGSTVSVTPGAILSIGSLSNVTVDATQDPFTDSNVSTSNVAIVNNGSFSVTTGSSTIASHTGTGSLSVSGGASLKLAPTGSGNSASAISIDSTSGSSLDLANNAFAVNYSGATPVQTIRQLLITGRNGGTWNGAGISSSVANSAGAHPTAIGYAEAAQVGITSTFFGQPVDTTTVLMRYTYMGDANLDGKVNALDFNALASNFGKPGGTEWYQGDFDYSGTTDTSDFMALAQNFGLTLPAPAAQLPAPVPLGTLVPEPTSLAMLATATLLLRRRRGNAPV